MITTSEVSRHNSAEDCYVIFDGKVYDITAYLQSHEEKFMDISPWCGKDLTEDFKNKAGRGRDHTGGYAVLSKYEIGELSPETGPFGVPLTTFYVLGLVVAGAALFGFVSYLLAKRKR